MDTVLAYDPRKKEEQAKEVEDLRGAESWSVSVAEIFGNAGIRLDASHFDPRTAAAIQHLKDSGLELKRLSDLASVKLRGIFTRIWAEDEQYGVRYFNATDMLSLLALGVPAGDMRYLSHVTETNIDKLLVREGWLLMTCSGTIGRVFYVPGRLDGWAATHDLIRIVPNDPEMTGYIHAWLATPIAQVQILSHTHGGQIDHVTDEQVSEVLVPLLDSEPRKRIHKQVMKALRSREQAIDALTNAWSGI